VKVDEITSSVSRKYVGWLLDYS